MFQFDLWFSFAKVFNTLQLKILILKHHDTH